MWMRVRRNCQMMTSWKIIKPHNCWHCGKKATGVLKAHWWGRSYDIHICDECSIKWARGDLYID